MVRPGGFLQFSIEHPLTTTARREWVDDADGRHVALSLGGYFERGETVERWTFSHVPDDVRAEVPPFEVPRFRRTLADWRNMVADSGWCVERVAEPYASADAVAAYPRLAGTRVAPLFLHVRARRS